MLYVLTFHTNIVSLTRAIAQGIHWNTENSYLTKNRKPLCVLTYQYGQWVIEYNPIPNAALATAAKAKRIMPTSKASARRWHERTGHPSMEVIKHLPEVADGIEIVDNDDDDQEQCEVCHLTTAKQQRSLRPMPRGSRPFERVHMDLIEMTPAYNGLMYAFHIHCDWCHIFRNYNINHKWEAREKLEEFRAWIRTQFGYDIAIIHVDGETALLPLLQRYERHDGFQLEISVPRTPSQNGATERSGGVMIGKARAIRIESKLPANLWPEFFNYAEYMMNRLPVRALKWKSPYQFLFEHLGRPHPRPNLSQLVLPGSKAFMRKKVIPKTHKVEPRA